MVTLEHDVMMFKLIEDLLHGRITVANVSEKLSGVEVGGARRRDS